MISPRNEGLQIEIKGERLVLSIGVGTIARAHEWRNTPSSEKVRIINPDGFARDVLSEMTYENEIGETIVTDMFDRAIENAINNGSMHCE